MFKQPSRHREPPGRREAPDDRLREAIDRSPTGRNGLLPPSLSELRRTPSPAKLAEQAEKGRRFAPRNDGKHALAFPRQVFARGVPSHCPSEPQRAQGKPGADCARSPVCEQCYRKAHGLNHRYSRDIPAFPAQWCYGLYVLSPGKRPFLPPFCGSKLPQVAPGSRRQDHTISPYAAFFRPAAGLDAFRKSSRYA
jgi:hypothetical protein